MFLTTPAKSVLENFQSRASAHRFACWWSRCGSGRVEDSRVNCFSRSNLHACRAPYQRNSAFLLDLKEHRRNWRSADVQEKGDNPLHRKRKIAPASIELEESVFLAIRTDSLSLFKFERTSHFHANCFLMSICGIKNHHWRMMSRWQSYHVHRLKLELPKAVNCLKSR